jgi:type I restriction enzyme M protein
MPLSAAKCYPTRMTPGSIHDATKIGYEVSFTRHFYKPRPLRTLAQIRQDIIDIEREAGGLLGDLLEGASA